MIAKTQQIKAGLMHDLFTRGLAKAKLRPPRNTHLPSRKAIRIVCQKDGKWGRY